MARPEAGTPCDVPDPLCVVPDTHGAVGTDYYTEVVNSFIAVYDKETNARLEGEYLHEFFGYDEALLFDPRALKDPVSARWIISAVAEEESATVQRFFVAVSKTTDVRGDFWYYSFDVNITGDEFFDFPQVGLDAGALIVTGNVYQRISAVMHGNFRYAEMFSLPKASLYTGNQVSSPVFPNLDRFLAPPIVLDTNPTSYLVSAPIKLAPLTLYAATDLDEPPNASITQQPDVIINYYRAPANAPDCQPLNELDAGMSEFVNTSTQVGNSLWQINSPSYDLGNTLPTPRWYEIDVTNSSLIQEGQVWTSSTSYDFNASIAANTLGDVVVTWTTVDHETPPGCPEIMYGGRELNDAPGTMEAAVLFTSLEGYNPHPAPFGGDPDVERWGDYSSVSFDPSIYPGCAQWRTAWIVNENVPGTDEDNWGSEIAKLSFC